MSACSQFVTSATTLQPLNKMKCSKLNELKEFKARLFLDNRHQSFLKKTGVADEPSLEDYVEAIKGRFGERVYKDPMADLKGLILYGSLQDYLKKFDVLPHKVTLSEEYALSCFLSGLEDKTIIPLCMFGPKSLQESYHNATKTSKPAIINP
ncbi:hypothetical protein Ccrd_024181 [Cynara cardunculus var. scolymus]|uniref:Uncharacterized protein n=1 Tax=Cynara cardunculus var. scolymus TaxID=59895 RepID=A0A118JSN6_CYNCS|nr:hypothetical protein Ccrd_024181 [Cynara cardunculus var. scolymus]